MKISEKIYVKVRQVVEVVGALAWRGFGIGLFILEIGRAHV